MGRTQAISKKAWIMMLAALVMIGMSVIYMPEKAYAATAGDFTVDGGTSGRDYSYENGVLTIKSNKNLTIKNNDPNTETNDRILVEGGVNANITLAGVNIASNSKEGALKIADNSTGNVTLTLAGGTTNKFQGNGSDCAGIGKNGNDGVGKLTIQGSGSLIANGGDRAPGIGSTGSSGISSNITSNIEIAGGNIEVNGQYHAAGIGGKEGSDASNITISGGNVKVSSGVDGAGIGSGYGNGSNASNITISGGTVSVEVHKTSSIPATNANTGIGNGAYSTASNIKITGGSLKFTGDNGFKAFGADPTDASGNPVQLLEISNPDSKTIKIDNATWSPSNHKALESSDTTLYAYLSKSDHTIAIGDKQHTYKYENGQFILTGTTSITNPVTLRINSGTNHWEVSYDEGDTWEEVLDDKGQPVTATGDTGATPKLRVNEGYWQVSYDGTNWDYVTDSSGEKVKASGSDGKNGITPQIKVNDQKYWVVSYDNGETWIPTGMYAGVDNEEVLQEIQKLQIASSSVTNLRAVSVKSKKVKVSWKAPKGISGLKYEVQYQKKGSKKWVTKTTSNTSLTVKKLKKKAKYRFKVRGYKTIDGEIVYTDFDTTSLVKVTK